VDTAATLRQGDAYVAAERARGYQVAVAGYLALLAVLTLCVYAQRTAATRRPADLMLARVGLGRARVTRARALEFVLLAAVAFAAAVAGVAALAPIGGRLLDDQPGLLPRFAFPLSPVALAVTAGVAVVATVLAVALTTVRSPSAEEDAYRDD
jgi:putative ABC transport system permease protein